MEDWPHHMSPGHDQEILHEENLRHFGSLHIFPDFPLTTFSCQSAILKATKWKIWFSKMFESLLITKSCFKCTQQFSQSAKWWCDQLWMALTPWLHMDRRFPNLGIPPIHGLNWKPQQLLLLKRVAIPFLAPLLRSHFEMPAGKPTQRTSQYFQTQPEKKLN